MIEPLRIGFAVGCSPAEAFALWTARTSLWWPRSHTVSGDPEDVVFEPRVGGRIFERARDGAEHDWGAVTAWEPSARLAYTWHLRQDRADATDVEIRFTTAAGGGTDVAIVHTGWERLGASGPDRREANGRGWSGLLPAFRDAAG